MSGSTSNSIPNLVQSRPRPQSQPPLARRPSSHSAYSTLVQIARTPNLKVVDIGCGRQSGFIRGSVASAGRDLLELLTAGALPDDLIGTDIEPQFSTLSHSLAKAKNLPVPPFGFVRADVGGLMSSPSASERLFLPHSMSGIVCYRFFHLHPPETQKALLRWLLGLLSVPSSNSEGRLTPSTLIGLQRSLPPGTPSGWTPISSSPAAPSSTETESAAHWVYSASDWHDLLETSVDEYSTQFDPSKHQVTFGTEFFPELDSFGQETSGGEPKVDTSRRGAVEWWVRVEGV